MKFFLLSTLSVLMCSSELLSIGGEDSKPVHRAYSEGAGLDALGEASRAIQARRSDFMKCLDSAFHDQSNGINLGLQACEGMAPLVYAGENGDIANVMLPLIFATACFASTTCDALWRYFGCSRPENIHVTRAYRRVEDLTEN